MGAAAGGQNFSFLLEGYESGLPGQVVNSDQVASNSIMDKWSSGQVVVRWRGGEEHESASTSSDTLLHLAM